MTARIPIDEPVSLSPSCTIVRFNSQVFPSCAFNSLQGWYVYFVVDDGVNSKGLVRLALMFR